MQNFQGLLFLLKQSFICCYIAYMTGALTITFENSCFGTLLATWNVKGNLKEDTRRQVFVYEVAIIHLTAQSISLKEIIKIPEQRVKFIIQYYP